ncbi:hypothetical protein NP493_109g07010 [Ridgeia piscesae]|uniref:Peroxisomal membrane protein PEX13 n=1 Tax=Ridgeia piscesae TaxID=27915 RepID=A0AAD9P701_RIDPI|nr:hypothetical protein NP493_109g07010 [Ridgeia piscesae]
MAAPPKPWERVGVNQQNAGNTFINQMSSGPPGPVMPENRGVAMPRQQPPALPPRPSQQQNLAMPMAGYGGGMNYNSYGAYGNSGLYNSPYMYNSMYSGGMYDGYGSSGFNRVGGDVGSQSSFVRTAQNSSQQAFQSIESVVQACRSISMMLDSTFYAVYNSFNAVIGVADHFSRLKQHLAKVLSALALIRTLKWLYRRLLVLLRLRQSVGLDEELWSQATTEAGATATWLSEGGAAGKPSHWPIVFFFAVVFGGPWLIWKLLSAFRGETEKNEWANGKDDHFVVVAEYDFQAQGDDELSFRQGQTITVAPKELQPRIRGWLLASVDGNKEGFIPANYIRVLGKRKGSRHMAKMTQDVEVPTTQVPCAEDTRWDGARPKTSSSEDQTSTQQMCEAQPASSSNRVGSGDSIRQPTGWVMEPAGC